MRTMDSLPHVPQAQMQQYLKEFEKMDKAAAPDPNAPGDIVQQLTPEQEVPQTQQLQQQEVEASTPHEEEQMTEQKLNIRALREKAERAERDRERVERERERAERERDELLQKFREMEYAKLQQQTQVYPEVEPNLTMDPNALAEGKNFNDLNHHYNKKLRQLEEKVKQNERQLSQRFMEAQLKTQYPDFDSVVSKAHVEELKRAHPSIAQALATAASTDEYSAAASLYTIIKEMGIAKSMQESTMTRKLLQENASKPRSAQAASPQRGSTPLSQVNEFVNDGKMSPEYQTQLLKEMAEARLRAR
jgi:hypothetical protein